MVAQKLFKADCILSNAGMYINTPMEIINNYHKGLLYLTYLLINPDHEISDNELYYLHKMRIEEGMTDAVFAEHFKSLIGKPEQEVYQIGIESLNRCPREYRIKVFKRLYHMALTDGILRTREVRFILYSINLPHVEMNSVMQMIHKQEVAA